jgi:hypothetical protein
VVATQFPNILDPELEPFLLKTSMLRKFVILCLLAGITGAVVVACAIATADYNADIPLEQRCWSNQRFELARSLAGIDPADLRQQFPCEIYLDSADWCSAEGIQADLRTLDAIRPDSALENRELLFNALTSGLEKRWEQKFSAYQPDTLISLAQWASRFYDYQEAVDENDARVFRIVSRHWFIKLSNVLSQIAEVDASVKYSFKFRYLVAVCQTKGFSPPISNSKLEKTVVYFIDQKYSYLFHRFWNSTDWKFKAIAGLGLLILLYGLVCIFRVHFLTSRK